MQEVLDDFAARIVDIDTYFDFLIEINKDVSSISYEEFENGTMTKRNSPVKSELQKILKANGFLLLYNLIESSFKDAIKSIFLSIKNKKLKYKDLTAKIQKIWINQKVVNLTEANNKSIFAAAQEIAQIVLDEVAADFYTDKMNKDLSGGVDAQKIREIADKYGFSSIVSSPKKGKDLVTIKSNRNHLAHGSKTFTECGKDYTITELISIKNNTVDFMTDILQNIENYIKNNHFSI